MIILKFQEVIIKRKNMKNLILITALLLSLNSFSQDTTVTFTDTIIFRFIPDSIDERPFITVDTINFNQFQDSASWRYSRWIPFDTVFINQNKYITKDVQFRRNKQGIKQRHVRLILWIREAIREQIIKY